MSRLNAVLAIVVLVASLSCAADEHSRRQRQVYPRVGIAGTVLVPNTNRPSRWEVVGVCDRSMSCDLSMLEEVQSGGPELAKKKNRKRQAQGTESGWWRHYQRNVRLTDESNGSQTGASEGSGTKTGAQPDTVEVPEDYFVPREKLRPGSTIPLVLLIEREPLPPVDGSPGKSSRFVFITNLKVGRFETNDPSMIPLVYLAESAFSDECYDIGKLALHSGVESLECGDRSCIGKMDNLKAVDDPTKFVTGEGSDALARCFYTHPRVTQK
jgi:hypothetical protein